MRRRLDTRQLIVQAFGRLRGGFAPVVLAALAAALAWLIAHNALDHSEPFFAPIAAAISLSTSRIQRSRRIVQLVAGVLLGIGVGELLVAILGTTTIALGVIVLLTFTAALLSGEGVFGEGMMFANQAAASAILVVTLHRAGTGSERVVDALVGGGVALVLGVILFPAHPLRLLHEAEQAVLRALVGVIDELAEFIHTDRNPTPDWTLQSGQRVHDLLGALARARATAHANVRVAPRRFHLRRAVDQEIDRVGRLDLLANAVLSLIRAAITAEDRGEHLSEPIARDIGRLGAALGRLAEAPRPWPDTIVEDVRTAGTRGADASPVVAAIIRAVARDLEAVVRGPLPPARDLSVTAAAR